MITGAYVIIGRGQEFAFTKLTMKTKALIIKVLVGLTVALSLTACGKKDKNNNSNYNYNNCYGYQNQYPNQYNQQYGYNAQYPNQYSQQQYGYNTQYPNQYNTGYNPNCNGQYPNGQYPNGGYGQYCVGIYYYSNGYSYIPVQCNGANCSNVMLYTQQGQQVYCQ